MQKINITPVLDKFKTNEIIILGLGKEGLSTYKFFRQQLPQKKLWLIDQKNQEELAPHWQKIITEDALVTFSTHLEHTQLDDARAAGGGIIVVKTPGIPSHNSLVKQARALDASFTSNSNIFFALVQLFNTEFKRIEVQNYNQTKTDSEPISLPPITVIGVTGTKGKSTATTVLHHVLDTAGLTVKIGGNIGTAPLSLWESVIESAQSLQETNQTETAAITFVALELSCHQLDTLRFSPHIAALLDITPEHLDFYKTFEAYLHAKAQICRFQTPQDFVVFDTTKELPAQIAQLANTTQLYFSDQNISQNWITDFRGNKIVDIDTLALVGKHTIYNTLPAVTIAHFLGVAHETIASALQSFKPLRHRLELVSKKNDVSYYNDSLSTTPVATIAAIQSFQNRPIILIAGGYDRGLDYSQLAQAILEHQVKQVLLLPETGTIIAEELAARIQNNMGEISIQEVTTLEEAVVIAKKTAEPGDTVLLSPASASFNMFTDYAERGDAFIKLVETL